MTKKEFKIRAESVCEEFQKSHKGKKDKKCAFMVFGHGESVTAGVVGMQDKLEGALFSLAMENEDVAEMLIDTCTKVMAAKILHRD